MNTMNTQQKQDDSYPTSAGANSVAAIFHQQLLPCGPALSSSNLQEGHPILKLKIDQHPGVIVAGSEISGSIAIYPTHLRSLETLALKYPQTHKNSTAWKEGKPTLSIIFTSFEESRSLHVKQNSIYMKSFGLIRSEYTRSGNKPLLTQDFDVGSQPESNIIEGGVVSFSFFVPQETPNTMERIEIKAKDGDATGFLGGHCGVVNQVKATFSIKNEASPSNSLNVHSETLSLNVQQCPVPSSPFIRYSIGPPNRMPMTFCGLYTYGHRDFYSLSIDSAGVDPSGTAWLFPGQQLRIEMNSTDGGNAQWKSAASKSFWKLTQRLQWETDDQVRGIFTTSPIFHTWKERLTNVDSGTVEVPSFHKNSTLRMTHEYGGSVVVAHEMIVYTEDNEGGILMTSPITKVILAPGYAESNQLY